MLDQALWFFLILMEAFLGIFCAFVIAAIVFAMYLVARDMLRERQGKVHYDD